MLKVLKVKHVKLYVGDFDEILVADDSIKAGISPCGLCIFRNYPSTDCALKHRCATKEASWNAYWIIRACTDCPNGEENPNGRHVDV